MITYEQAMKEDVFHFEPGEEEHGVQVWRRCAATKTGSPRTTDEFELRLKYDEGTYTIITERDMPMFHVEKECPLKALPVEPEIDLFKGHVTYGIPDVAALFKFMELERDRYESNAITERPQRAAIARGQARAIDSLLRALRDSTLLSWKVTTDGPA